MNIILVHNTETVRYAAEELAKHLHMMDGVRSELAWEGDVGIKLGLLSDFGLSDPCHRESRRILAFHVAYCKRLAGIFVALSLNEIKVATALPESTVDYLSEMEPEIHRYFDLVLFKQRTEQIIAGK